MHSGSLLMETAVEVSQGLYIKHINAQRRLYEVWGELQGYLVSALGTAGLDNVRAEELTVLPGAEELLALLEVREQAVSGTWDAVVVDCAPTAETLRLLALPEALEWYLGRALPTELKVVRALRPLLGPAIGLPAPRQEVWEAADATTVPTTRCAGSASASRHKRSTGSNAGVGCRRGSA